MTLEEKKAEFQSQIIEKEKDLEKINADYEFWRSLSRAISDAKGDPNSLNFEKLQARTFKDLADELLIPNGIQFVYVDTQ